LLSDHQTPTSSLETRLHFLILSLETGEHEGNCGTWDLRDCWDQLRVLCVLYHLTACYVINGNIFRIDILYVVIASGGEGRLLISVAGGVLVLPTLVVRCECCHCRSSSDLECWLIVPFRNMFSIYYIY
jgi:hypothetical protein